MGCSKRWRFFVNQDFDATLKKYDECAEVITNAIKKFGVTALPRQFNPQVLGNVTPHYSWHIDPARLNITGPEVIQKLADTRPIGIGSMGAGASGMRGRNPDGGTNETFKERHSRNSDLQVFGFAVWQLKAGEDKMIAERLAEIFSAARKS